ncbi:visual pigment-like receptor peropsin [Nematostella vectensis]|uniref:visual pigment-like receptor peropsin n=1 Tax=Nematostella vectensis TaxID=45351 RepID=UPI002076E749|nr:visual pigment-like receptor peropsin [Nematostella vectensis]XP_048587690.1 visual pigment-like receptor peropsin [Nematostella vectensis]
MIDNALGRHEANIVLGYYIAIFVIGFVTNTIVVIIFISSQRLHTTPNLILFSMSVCDWLMAAMAKSVGIYGNARYWPTVGKVTCDYYAFATSAIGYASILHLAALAVEKRMAVVSPMTNSFNGRRMLVIIATLWGFAILWAVFPLIGWSSYGPEPGYVSCSITWYTTDHNNVSYIICVSVLFFLIPIVTMTFCFASIYHTIRNLSHEATARWGSDARATQETIRAKAKTAKMAFLMVMCFLFAWTPYAVVSLWTTFGDTHRIPALLGVLPSLFAKLSSCYNPIIYFFMYTKFRYAAKRFFIKNIIRPSETERSRVLSGIRTRAASPYLAKPKDQADNCQQSPIGNTIRNC